MELYINKIKYFMTNLQFQFMFLTLRDSFFYLNFLLLKLIVAIVTETNPGVLGNDEYPSYCRLH